MLIKSYAKINVSLKVLGRREDGYHELELVNLPISLHDVVEISRIRAVDSYVTTDDPDLAQLTENLASKALSAMREAYHFSDNFEIVIHKGIPFAAGLGGGSSNAASVMLGVNKMLKLGATYEDLCKIGLKLGTDVPYFLDPEPALLTGVGEKIMPIVCKKRYYCLLVKPEQGLSTKDVYAASDRFPKARIDTDAVVQALATGDDLLLEKAQGNDLLPAAESLLPEVGQIFASLKKQGFFLSCMTGSGSTCFALTDDGRKAKEGYRYFENQGYITKLCRVMR